MEVVHRCGAGIDVHKRNVVVCVRKVDPAGKVHKAVRTYETTTGRLLEMADWFEGERVEAIAMESTGVYWKPVYNLLVGGPWEILLVNAQHIKKVPGRKTDVKDCEWIADLLQHGLLRGSFVPSESQRDLRDLTRYRAKLVQEKASEANRIQKILEECNVKLASVATDTLGVSGRAILEALVAGETNPSVLSELAKGRLRNKIPELALALEGRVTDHHRFMLAQVLDHIRFLETRIAELERRIEERMVPFEKEVSLLVTIPGVDQTVAHALIAEIGVEMKQFPTSQQLASWAGICPGNNESGGKHKSGKIRKGNLWARRVLTQAAWAASHTKNTYYSSLYRRLAARRGKKRAIVALAHSILVSAHAMLQRGVAFHELGPHYLDRRNATQVQRYCIKRLRSLGLEVTVVPLEQAA